MPLTEKGQTILANFKKQYGEEKGEQYFYAAKNKGTVKGVDSAEEGALVPVPRRNPEVTGTMPTEQGGYKVNEDLIGQTGVPATRPPETHVYIEDGMGRPVGNQTIRDMNVANRNFWKNRI